MDKSIGKATENLIMKGLAKHYGTIKFPSLNIKGTFKGENVECLDSYKICGKAKHNGFVKSKNISNLGTFISEKDICATETLKSKGTIKCKETIQSKNINVLGTINCKNVDSKNLDIIGAIECEKLSADNIKIKFSDKIKIDTIDGKNINIFPNTINRIVKTLPIFRKKYNITNEIKGEEIFIEYIKSPKVIGKKITIGKRCNIDLVQYTDSIEISPKAKVKNVEKIKE